MSCRNYEINTSICVVIGAAKSGTSSIYRYMRAHPDITVTTIKQRGYKECNFFSSDGHYNKGHEWYKSLFEEKNKVYADVSPNYSRDNSCQTAERIAHFSPDAKIIYILRDPVERFISHYLHRYSSGRIKKTVRNLLREKNIEQSHLINQGKYGYHLKNYLSYFNSNQILLMNFNELVNDRIAAINRIFHFLRLDSIQDHNDFHQIALNSTHKKAPSLIETYTRKGAIRKWVKKLAPANLNEKRVIKRPKMTVKDQQKILEFYKEDFEILEQNGFDCSEWKR